jgi:hypothetical protein
VQLDGARGDHVPRDLGKGSLTRDAALCIALVATALPFARNAREEVDRWLRVLRLNGHAGRALQGLGVGELRLRASADAAVTALPGLGTRAVDLVVERSLAHAAARGSSCADTGDVLAALLSTYGEEMEKALAAHGATVAEVERRLARPLVARG